MIGDKGADLSGWGVVGVGMGERGRNFKGGMGRGVPSKRMAAAAAAA